MVSLINMASSLNHGSNIVAKIKGIERLCAELSECGSYGPSFSHFLNELCVAERLIMAERGFDVQTQ